MSIYPNRRKLKDPLLKYLTAANAAAAIGLFVAVCIAAIAKPEAVTFFDHFYKVNAYRRPHWDMILVDYIAIMLVISVLTSIIGLAINSRRLKRKGDYVRATLVICLLLSLAGLGLYIGYA
jgi:quinol-cytochrome oxidoreductase complex cytochrome b subunit